MSKLQKSSFVILFLFVFFTAAQAQIIPSVGLRGGLNFANLSEQLPRVGNQRTKIGMNLGAALDISFNRYWSLRTEANLSIRGALLQSVDTVFCDPNNLPVGATCNGNVGQNTSLVPRETDLSLSYLEVPVMIHYMFEGGGLRPSVFGGAAFGFLVSWQQNNFFGNTTSTYNKNNVDAVLGVGINQQLNNGKFFSIDTRYYFGLSDIHKDESIEQKHRMFTLNATLLFPLVKYEDE